MPTIVRFALTAAGTGPSRPAFAIRRLIKESAMRESSVGSIARRLVKAASSMGEAIVRGLGSLVEGAAPAPQLVPVRVRAARRRS
jgi:hypothetical protein